MALRQGRTEMRTRKQQRRDAVVYAKGRIRSACPDDPIELRSSSPLIEQEPKSMSRAVVAAAPAFTPW